MYDESEIDYALHYRNWEASAKKYHDDEADLLMTIRYTYYTNKVIKSGDKQYRSSFLGALADHGIEYRGPRYNDDKKWHFKLPVIEEGDYDD